MPVAQENPQPKPAPVLRIALMVGIFSTFLAIALHGRTDGSDTSLYLDAAKNFWQSGAIDADSFFQNRLGMSIPVALLGALFDWAPFSWALYPALMLGVLSGASFYALRLWLPALRPAAGIALTLLVPGALRGGALLFPDIPQAAMLSLGLLLLFRPQYALPSRAAALTAGLAFGVMISINPTALRFGLIVLILAVLWWRRLSGDDAKTLLRRAGLCALGVGVILLALAIAQAALSGDFLLHYRQLSASGIPDEAGGRVDGLRALWRWLRAGFGPFGEFGLMALLAIVAIAVARKSMAAEARFFFITWFAVVVLSIAYVVVPQMLLGRAGVGEMPTRYLLPATLPVVVLVGALLLRLQQQKALRLTIWAGIIVSFGLALLLNHKPRLLTVSALDAFAELRADSSLILYADPRLARRISQEWGREVRPLSEIDGDLGAQGIAFIWPRERALLKRKYGPEVAPVIAEGFALGQKVAGQKLELSLWQELAAWLERQKAALLGRPSDLKGIRAFHIQRR